MKERLITLGGALLAIYAIYLLLLPKPQPELEPLSLPTTEDRGNNGIAVAYQLLKQSGIPTYTLRHRYTSLYAAAELPEQGNLLIVSLPLRINSRTWEEQQLQNWVNEGNSILLLSTLSDDPEWNPLKYISINRFVSLFGFSFDKIEHEPPETSEEPESDNRKDDNKNKKDKQNTYSLEPVPRFTLTRGINKIEVTNHQLSMHYWDIYGQEGVRSTRPILNDPGTNSPAMWLARSGSGKVYISRYSRLFSNASLEKHDNARFLINLLQHTLSESGYVIFDDMHQGLSELYNPDAFFSDNRLHNTLWFIFALWFIYVLGHTNRLQPVREQASKMRLVDNIRGIAHFMARRLHRSAVARRMFLHFFNELRRYLGMQRNGEPVWNELSNYQQLTQSELTQLKNYYDQAQRQQSVNLVRLGQLINTIRKKLL